MRSVRPKPLPPREHLWHQMGRSALLAGTMIGTALVIGVIGYHTLGRLDWVDAFYNASMILSGMGPDAQLPSRAAKIFASIYALFSGVVFLSSVGVLMGPALHRFLHRFHLETIEDE